MIFNRKEISIKKQRRRDPTAPKKKRTHPRNSMINVPEPKKQKEREETSNEKRIRKEKNKQVE